MMIDNNSLLKILLEADADPNDPLKQPNERPSKPKGFEEDPMGFIIRKYDGLRKTLEELMSSDFKQYLTAIFVVAPKPTTFKVILHNGQYFFITYMGKGFYEANVAGKRYYMNNIGVKEGAMQAITRLLKYGSPLNSKGPEGAEQGTRPEEASEESSGGGEAATSETPTPETGEETLKEVEFVKSLLKFRNTDQNLINILIKEAVAPKLKTELLNQLKSLGFSGKPDSKHGAHLRFNLVTAEDAENEIEVALDKISPDKFYDLTKIEKGDFASGAKSGTFDTYKIEVIKPAAGLEKGDTVFVVNQVTKAGTIVAKSLTPTNLGLTGRNFTDENELASYVNKQLESKVKNPELVKALSNLTINIAEKAHTRFQKVSLIKEEKDVVELTPETVKLLSKFSPTDLNIIGKDFGEVLGAIQMLKSVVNAGVGVEFPKGNNPLVDFTIDNYQTSSKYQVGAAASLIQVLKGIDPKKLENDPDQLDLYNILKIAIDSDTAQGYINVARAINSKGLKSLAKILGVSQDKVTIQFINDVMTQLFSRKNNKQKTEILKSKFGPFYETIGRSPRMEAINWEKIGENYFGLVSSPLAYSVVDDLNNNPKYTKALKEILSKIEVKQLYLDFSLSKSTASFNLKNFSSATFKFGTNVSTYNPTNSKLAFSLVK